MQARQSEEMALAQSFLNRLWQVEHDGKRWFNPDISIIYPDRIRRRPPAPHPKDWERIPTPARWSAGFCQPISGYSPVCLTATSSSTIRGMRLPVTKRIFADLRPADIHKRAFRIDQHRLNP